ncbi:MAG: ATP-binding protein [Verrucomicrobiae bacterium]|nr:ATP-binding protein [Verrucomicrobiae bacterium]
MRCLDSTLDLLDGWRDSLRDLAARRAAEDARHRKALALELARARAGLDNEDQRHAEAAQRTSEWFRQALARTDERHRSRSGRLERAKRQAGRSMLERIEAREGQRKYDLQREMLRVTRDRDSRLAAADATLAAWSAHLAGQRTFLDRLEKATESSLGVYGRWFRDRWLRAHENVTADVSGTEDQLAEQLGSVLQELDRDLGSFRRRILPRVSGGWPLGLALAFVPCLAIPVLQHLGYHALTYREAAAFTAAALALGVFLYFAGRRGAAAATDRILEGLGQARLLHEACTAKAETTHRQEREAAQRTHDEAAERATHAWHDALETAARERAEYPARLDARFARGMARHERLQQQRRRSLEADRDALEESQHQDHQERRAALERESQQRRNTIEAKHREASAVLDAESDQRVRPALERLEEARRIPVAESPGWEEERWAAWEPPVAFAGAVRCGRLEVDLPRFTGLTDPEPHRAGAPPEPLTLPLLLTFPEQGSLWIETRGGGRDMAISALNQVVLRLLAESPPGRIGLTVIDPVGLGGSFAGIMHLTDQAEHLVDGRLWTQPGQIEERLGELNEHLEKVIQTYLRDEYATIAEYNREAGHIAERYRFLVIADFPVNFSELALRRLRNILVNGPRCGVYTLAHHDARQPLPAEFPTQEWRAATVRLRADHGPAGFALADRETAGLEIHLERAPAPEVAIPLLQMVARASADSHRVEVPFQQVAPDDSQRWSLDTRTELRVPIGRTGATKLQYLSLGKGTRQHALIAGKTGSGKSTLFHVLITNLALWHPPGEVEFYLVDFKKGVEFKCYAAHRLPHARVVAIESDREFGVSVLQRVDEELRHRGDLFRAAGVQNLDAYRATANALPMPRVLLLIDEFQEFFVEEDRLAQTASLLLDRIVRQGRAFGVHAILGSQTLGGAYTVARSTLGQMVVRIALQCNEADAYLIMDDGNAAPRLLSRPGEGIYNDAAGAREGNSPFQTVWLPDDVRDRCLAQVRQRADQSGFTAGPMIFEGDAPADPGENEAMRNLWNAPAPQSAPAESRIWLGAPNAIKGPTEVILARRRGDHLLVVGQREESATAILVGALAALGAQFPPGRARFLVLDGHPPEGRSRQVLDSLTGGMPHEVVSGTVADLDAVLERAGESLRTAIQGGEDAPGPTHFLLLHGLEHFRRLRADDDFGYRSSDAPATPAERLKSLLDEGPGHGFHILATVGTYADAVQALGRKTLAEFGWRVLFQMGANDSANLIDSPQASRLGLHRALLYQERAGTTELFRPYALPDASWMDEARTALAKRAPHR